MKIVWTDYKWRSNLKKHRLDFADLPEDFFADALIAPAKKGRWKAIGEFRGETIIAVIFATLGSEALSLISMRPASRAERSQHTER